MSKHQQCIRRMSQRPQSQHMHIWTHSPALIPAFYFLSHLVSIHPLAWVETADLWHSSWLLLLPPASLSSRSSCLSWETALVYILSFLFNHFPHSSSQHFLTFMSSTASVHSLHCSRGMIQNTSYCSPANNYSAFPQGFLVHTQQWGMKHLEYGPGWTLKVWGFVCFG